MKLGSETGSLINHLMSSNNNLPEVGKGATILHWTDREAWEVIEVSKSGKEVKLQKYDAERIDNNGMSDSQNYKYEKLLNNTIDVVFRWGSWKIKRYEIVFTDEFLQKNDSNSKKLHEEYVKAGGTHNDNCHINKVIPNITKKITKYSDIKISWGVKNEYYDYSF